MKNKVTIYIAVELAIFLTTRTLRDSRRYYRIPCTKNHLFLLPKLLQHTVKLKRSAMEVGRFEVVVDPHMLRDSGCNKLTYWLSDDPMMTFRIFFCRYFSCFVNKF